MDLNNITGHIVSSAIAVHTEIGPGALESSYEACMAFELMHRGLRVETQVPMPLRYRGHELTVGYRLDLLVEDRVVVELKAVTKVLPVHHAQILSYLKMGGFRVGLLLNFHVPRMVDGIVRFAR